MNNEGGDKIRIVDIARLAGVSAGTVDRVIHERGRVSEDKKKKVEAVLEQFGYEPNMAARSLASRKDFTIAVIAPTYPEGSYWELVYKGMERAAAELKSYGVKVVFSRFDQYDPASFDAAAVAARGEGTSGVLMATHFLPRVVELSGELDSAGVPYVYIDSGIEGCGNLAYFGGDSLVSGSMAAKLLVNGTGLPDRVFVAHIKFARKDISLQMQTRYDGFAESLRKAGYKGEIDHLELDPDKPLPSTKKMHNYLRLRGGKTGGIVLNSRVYQLIEIMDRIADDVKAHVKLVGFEAIPANVKALMEGKVASLVSQRPELQGYYALKAMGEYLLYSREPDKENLMPLDILIKENAPYYLSF
ncbi:MAG: LacI family DNA-binding transcriptional regulator [Alistipes sp.]|nr:LacI family DNA-binding transcriptional regulator [Alistipes sp.]